MKNYIIFFSFISFWIVIIVLKKVTDNLYIKFFEFYAVMYWVFIAILYIGGK